MGDRTLCVPNLTAASTRSFGPAGSTPVALFIGHLLSTPLLVRVASRRVFERANQEHSIEWRPSNGRALIFGEEVQLHLMLLLFPSIDDAVVVNARIFADECGVRLFALSL